MRTNPQPSSTARPIFPLLSGASAAGWRLGLTAVLLAATWLGVNAIWGLTSGHDTLISGALRRLAPLSAWIAAGAAVLITVAVLALVRRRRRLFALAAMLLAYLGGVLASRLAYVAVDPEGGVPVEGWSDLAHFAVERGFVLVPALPMLAVFLLPELRRRGNPFRFGEWRSETRIFRSREKPRTWRRQLAGWALFAVLPTAFLMQAGAGFEPVASGRLFALLPFLVLMALANACAEEILFRGFLQRPLVAYAGTGAGIWLQGAFFGIHHWGASPDPVASLPMALATVLLGVVWGKSVEETGGLGWAIACHALFDLAFFAAFFV